MADKGIKFGPNAAGQIRKAVRIVLNQPEDQTGKRPRRLSFGKPHILYCKIESDFSNGYPAPSQINATPCKRDGTILDGATAIAFDLCGHLTALEAYCNLKAGDVVAYEPYNESKGGIIIHQPIVATTDQYAVLQVGTASGSGTGGRVVFDWVRAHG